MDELSTKSRLRRVMTTVILAFLMLNAYFLWWSYKNSLEQAERGSLMRLAGIANTLALQIDGDQHEKLMARFSQKDAILTIGQDSNYAQIHALLRRNFLANMLKTPIYTIIMDGSGKSVFGVTSAEMPYFRHEYHSAPALLIEKHTEGAMIPIYKDEFGTWLSAFASIRNHKNEVVGVVQADQKFDEFLQQARHQIWKNLWISLVVFAGFLIILVRILQPILKKEQENHDALVAANFENKTMRGQLEVNLEKLTSLDNFRKEMIANLSHDLRTPMSSILGYLETVLIKKEQLSSDEKNRFLNVAFSESKRLNRLVTELFELSKLESGQIRLDLEAFSIVELAQDTLQKYQLTAEAKHVQLLTVISDDLPLVFADIKWMDRVLQNLLDNAIRFAGEGGFVQFTIFEKAEKLHFKICNSGTPIPEAHLASIFDRYFTSANRTVESTGLGLAIIKKIMDLHGETVVAEVNDGVTTFRFTLAILGK
jgi:signal transduction histidine kinase